MNFSLQNLLLPQRKQGEVKDILFTRKHKKHNDKQPASGGVQPHHYSDTHAIIYSKMTTIWQSKTLIVTTTLLYDSS